MKKRYIYALSSLLFLGTVSSCSMFEDFGDTNDNPSATTVPNIGGFLSYAEYNITGFSAGSGVTTPGYYAQYFSETQYPSVSFYAIQQLSFTGSYSGVLNTLQAIINEEESNNMSQIARILQQYVYLQVTDRWGDVPYSEALQALENPKPKYDTQEEIYKGVLTVLADAVSSFDGSPITGDLIFGGDIAAWKKAANSLRMMAAVQLSKRYPEAGGYAATAFNAALNDAAGYISSNNENFTLNFPGGNYKSLWYNVYDGRKDLAESSFLVSLLAGLSDTRQDAFGGATEAQGASNSFESSDVGVPYGATREVVTAFTEDNTDWARVLRGDFRTESSPVIILSAASVTLARAEAANLGWTTENVSDVYQAGVGLSFEQFGINMPSNYLTQSGVALGSDNAKKIAIQQYIAAYPNGMLAWNIWRKTGYPELTPTENAANESKQIPRRIAYSTNEYATNKENVEAAVERLSEGDTQDSRIWWDQ